VTSIAFIHAFAHDSPPYTKNLQGTCFSGRLLSSPGFHLSKHYFLSFTHAGTAGQERVIAYGNHHAV
jgi:hypothetical protein